jgi:hypothetical protein
MDEIKDIKEILEIIDREINKIQIDIGIKVRGEKQRNNKKIRNTDIKKGKDYTKIGKQTMSMRNIVMKYNRMRNDITNDDRYWELVPTWKSII